MATNKLINHNLHYETQFSFSTKMASANIAATNDHKSEENKDDVVPGAGPPNMVNLLSESLLKRCSYYDFDDQPASVNGDDA